MYKKTSQNSQKVADKISLKDFIQGGEDLFGEDRIKMLREELRKLEMEILKCEDKKHRKFLGKRKFCLQVEITRCKGQVRKGLHEFFITAAKNVLTKELYEKVYEEAERIYDIYNRQKNDLVNEQTYIQAEKLGIDL